MNTDISDAQAKTALQEKERQAEILLANKAQTKLTLNKAEQLLSKLRTKPVINKLVDDIETSIALVNDYIYKRYRNVPTPIVVSTLAGLLYIISPIDLIPDFIPGIGYVDDAIVFTLVLNTGLSGALKKYRQWNKMQKGEPIYNPIWSDLEE